MGVSEGKIDCIPLNDEKYISFTKEIVVEKFTKKAEGDDGKDKEVQIKRTIRFIDSFRFMASGLARLGWTTCQESLWKTYRDTMKGQTLIFWLGRECFHMIGLMGLASYKCPSLTTQG